MAVESGEGAVADAVRDLVRLGWTETEARLYCELLRRPGCSGYEIARAAGMARANAYEGLGRLERRGAATRCESRGVARYTAVPFADLAGRLVRDYRDVVREVGDLLGNIRPEEGAADPGVGLVDDRESLWALASSLAGSSEREVRLAQTHATACRLERDVVYAIRAGAACTTLCLDDCAKPCGHCHGRVLAAGETSFPKHTFFVCRDGTSALWGREDGSRGLLATDPDLVAWLQAAYDSAASLGTVLAPAAGSATPRDGSDGE